MARRAATVLRDENPLATSIKPIPRGTYTLYLICYAGGPLLGSGLSQPKIHPIAGKQPFPRNCLSCFAEIGAACKIGATARDGQTCTTVKEPVS